MPRVDLPELLLNMHARNGFAAEFRHASGREATAGDLMTSSCAVLLVDLFVRSRIRRGRKG